MTQQMDRPLQRAGWRPSRVLVRSAVAGGLALLAILGVMFVAGARSSLRVSAADLTIDAVKPGVFHDFVLLRAKAAPRDVVNLAALEGGQIEQILAQAGDLVVVGQPLVRFRNTELELDVLDREGRLTESITQLQAYEKQLEDTRVANQKAAAQIDYDILRLTREKQRSDALMAQGFTSRKSHQAVHDELAHHRRLKPLQASLNAEEEALRRRQLPQIRAELVNLQKSLVVARSKMDTLTLRAPVAGKLADMHLNVGEIKGRGEKLGQIVGTTGFKIEAQVDEYYLARVRTGQTGDVSLDGRRFPLVVTRVDPQVKDAAFRVELAFTGATPKDLAPGQTLEGRLTLGSDREGLILPAGSFLERTGGAWAMVLDDSGRKARRRDIKLGRRNGEQVEVLAGLRSGERVITSDYSGFDTVEQILITP